MEVKDPVYSFEIARRAVGRAAFHLGVDSMSEAALDVLADVLLNYLNRVGRTLSHLTEASGRTSAHVNLLDALQACELVASPAIERMYVRNVETDDQLFAPGASSTTTSQLMSSDWKGLASFLFGANWLDEKEGESKPKESKGLGGKQGPSAAEEKEGGEKKVGWDAPYLDEVPAYPLATVGCANPHPFPSDVALSLHRKQEENVEEVVRKQTEVLDELPDHIFDTWGSLSKRKIQNSDVSSPVSTSDTAAPPTKKAKIVDFKEPQKKPSENNESQEKSDEDGKAKLHIPPFYPPQPVTTVATDDSKKVVDVTQAPRIQAEGQNSQTVRSSLVQLGNYWGSSWESNAKSKTAKNIAVPLGRSEAREQQAPSTLVVPLGRASGSRVSRILEGSMDAAAMQ